MTILSPQHMTIPTNTAYHSQLIYGFIQTQHEHQIHRSLSIFELYSTHCSHHGSFCPLKNSNLTFFQATCFTSIQYCCPYITNKTAHFTFRGNLLYSNLPHSLNITHPHLVLAVTAASHPPPVLNQSPRYVNSITVYTMTKSGYYLILVK